MSYVKENYRHMWIAFEILMIEEKMSKINEEEISLIVEKGER